MVARDEFEQLNFDHRPIFNRLWPVFRISNSSSWVLISDSCTLPAGPKNAWIVQMCDLSHSFVALLNSLRSVLSSRHTITTSSSLICKVCRSFRICWKIVWQFDLLLTLLSCSFLVILDQCKASFKALFQLQISWFGPLHPRMHKHLRDSWSKISGGR